MFLIDDDWVPQKDVAEGKEKAKQYKPFVIVVAWSLDFGFAATIIVIIVGHGGDVDVNVNVGVMTTWLVVVVLLLHRQCLSALFSSG